MQEAAIAAMTDLERLRSPDRFGAWFRGIALNVPRKWLRQLQSEVPGLRPDLASVALDPAEAAEIADTAARVRAAIAALADGQQHAVRLFNLQGLSHREVAEELGISVGAVRLPRLRRLGARLVDPAVPLVSVAGLAGRLPPPVSSGLVSKPVSRYGRHPILPTTTNTLELLGDRGRIKV